MRAHTSACEPPPPPPLKTATVEEQLHQKAAVSHLALSPSSFPRRFSRFFSSSVAHSSALLSLSFVSSPVSFSSFSPLPLLLPYLPTGDILIYFYFCANTGGLTLFFFNASKDPYHRFSPVHQPPTSHPIHQTAAASLTDSCLISHKLVLPLTHTFSFVSRSYSFHSPHALSLLPSLSGPHI